MPSRHSLCIHGHFYQPPREDPFTGQIPVEAGSAPYKNWNEKIFETCYKPNADLGNFSNISFNLGPTLTQWMETFHPETLKKIVQADQTNLKRYGVGNAIAQGYNHSIFPLINRRDKQTQVIWGIYDFKRTFGRKPQGMWLPETAVDMETLEILADNDIEFTILAPWQADQRDLDTKKAYQVMLGNHKSIKVFFYHSGISSRISFDARSTENADLFVTEYIKNEFSSQNENQMLLAASDGELYGHHQVFRDKFLSYLLDGSISCQNIEASFPAIQLQIQSSFPIVKIKENTSWSCHHGIERWRGVCACTPNSEWKKHLKEAIDKLAIMIDNVFIETYGAILKNPWQARNEYISILSGDRKYANWIMEQTYMPPSAVDFVKIQTLLEAQVERLRMFTSCGWFFEDFDRIEPTNNVIYAAHAVWLTKLATGVDLVRGILPFFEKVKSWKTGLTASQVFLNALSRYDKEMISNNI